MCDLCLLVLIMSDWNTINCRTLQLHLLSRRICRERPGQSLRNSQQNKMTECNAASFSEATLWSNPYYCSLLILSLNAIFQVLIHSALSKFTTSILTSTSVLAVNSFLIATKVNELDTKQSLSVSKTSFTQQYPANLSEMLIRGPILSAYTALIK